jgi:hypothetical protein
MRNATLCPDWFVYQRSGQAGGGGTVSGMASDSSATRFIVIALVVLIAIAEAYIWIAGQSGWD